MVGKPLTSGDPAEIGPYTLVSRLGEGGMGVVYLATGPAGKRVALKVIRPHLASHDQFLERFRSEVALARKVARFCTAPILDSDTDSDPPYIVSEYVDGPTLTAAVAENGPLSGSELHALGVGVANALTAIHRAGIVHRDLKPSNVLLSRYGPRVIDFGIAKAIDAITSITQTGQFVGSPSYTAPERYRGEPMTPQTDIFAWGSVIAFAGTGRAPFGTVPEAIAYKVVHGEPDLDGLDPQLADLIRWTLSKEPADRPTAQELLDTLLDEEHGGAPDMRRRRPVPSASPSAPAPEPATEELGGSDTVTAPLPSPKPRRTGRLIASALAVALLFSGAAGGGWYAWQYVKRQRATTAQPRSSAPPVAPSPSPPAAPTTAAVVKDDTAKGPAPEIPGAKAGGTITAVDSSPFPTLDPQRVYDERAMSVGSALLYRSLTGYIDDGKGSLRLVGDLATNTGVTTDGGYSWTYTLRPGITFQDGTPITAQDVAYGVQRSFAKADINGPPYIQNWLMDTPTMSDNAYREKWAGPYADPDHPPTGLQVLSDTQIQFSFSRKHPEFPMVAALGTTVPVPKSADTRNAYGKGTALIASGPYKIAGNSGGRLELVRNQNWKPETDPIRHAYPNSWIFRFGVSGEAATDRIVSNSGEYASAFAWSNVPATRASKVSKEFLLSAPTPPQHFLVINTLRVKNLAHRKAINAAINRQVAMERFRDATHGRPSTTIMSEALPGFTPHKGLGDIGPTGNPELARKLLNGDTPSLRIAYAAGNAPSARLVQYVESALEDVGFTVELVKIDNFWATVEDPGNEYDLYPYFWGPDIPDGSGVFDHLFDNDSVGQPGNRNASFLRESLVGSEILRLQVEPDRNKAAVGYGKLDEMILHDYAPVVPLFSQQQFSVFGHKLAGLYVHRAYGSVGLTNARVT